MGPRERPFFLARTFFGSGPPVGNCGRLFICRTGHSAVLFSAMGYNARNDEIRDNVTRMRREWEAQRGSLATVRRFNATLSAKGYVWFWPKIAAAITSKHHWLIINCDSCGTVIDLDLRVKPRDPEASIRVALRDVQCPRCNGHGRPRIIALAQHHGTTFA
jgi:hypothetical protein